jgi:hypothetical protein
MRTFTCMFSLFPLNITHSLTNAHKVRILSPRRFSCQVLFSRSKLHRSRLCANTAHSHWPIVAAVPNDSRGVHSMEDYPRQSHTDFNLATDAPQLAPARNVVGAGALPSPDRAWTRIIPHVLHGQDEQTPKVARVLATSVGPCTEHYLLKHTSVKDKHNSYSRMYINVAGMIDNMGTVQP